MTLDRAPELGLDGREVLVQSRRRPHDFESASSDGCPRAGRRCRRRAAGSGRPGSRRSRTARRDRRARGSGARSPGGTCRPPRRAARGRASGTSDVEPEAEERAEESPRGRVISSTASLPPGRRTRASSRRPPSRSARLRTPNPTVAASNSPSPNGSASASPCTHSIAPDFFRARSSILSEKSRPTTRPPRRSASTARSPVPQHASSTRSPGQTTSLTASFRQRRSSPAVITRFIAS